MHFVVADSDCQVRFYFTQQESLREWMPENEVATLFHNLTACKIYWTEHFYEEGKQGCAGFSGI